MATAQQVSAFSEDGQYLAYSSPDGTLRIYEYATGILKQEFSSTSHLSAVTSALEWNSRRVEAVCHLTCYLGKRNSRFHFKID